MTNDDIKKCLPDACLQKLLFLAESENISWELALFKVIDRQFVLQKHLNQGKTLWIFSPDGETKQSVKFLDK